MLVGLIQPVREGHGLVLNALTEPVREDLVEHLALDALRRLEIRLVDRDLPAFALLPADHAAVVGPAHDAAEVGIQIKVIEVQTRVAQHNVHRKVVLVRGLPVKFHAVVHGHIVFAFLLQNKVRVHIAQLLGDAQRKVHGLPGAHGTKGLFKVGVVAVEQTRQKRSSFLKKAPAGEMPPGPCGFTNGIYLPMGTGETYQISRA